MSPALMAAIAVAAVLVPFVLLALFNGGDVSDGRGRRLSRRWRTATHNATPSLRDRGHRT